MRARARVWGPEIKTEIVIQIRLRLLAHEVSNEPLARVFLSFTENRIIALVRSFYRSNGFVTTARTVTKTRASSARNTLKKRIKFNIFFPDALYDTFQLF